MARRRTFRLLSAGVAASPRIAWWSTVALCIGMASATALVAEFSLAPNAAIAPHGETLAQLAEGRG